MNHPNRNLDVVEVLRVGCQSMQMTDTGYIDPCQNYCAVKSEQLDRQLGLSSSHFQAAVVDEEELLLVVVWFDR